MNIYTLKMMLTLLLLPVIGWGQSYTVTTLAGSGNSGYAEGTRTAASFSSPHGVAVDSAGNVYVADFGNHRIRKISPIGEVVTLAGSGNSGYIDGIGTAASFSYLEDIAVDRAGNVYVADRDNHRIRKISPIGVVTTLAGSGNRGFADGLGISASFDVPTSVSVDVAGNVYVADLYNHCIRKISPAGLVTTFAGSGSNGYVDAMGSAASFSNPNGVAVDEAGNVYVSDRNNNRIRKISPAGMVTTLAGSGIYGFADGIGAAARFNGPLGVAVDGDGNVYVADEGNNRIRKISPSGLVTTIAGSGNEGYTDGEGTAASFKYLNNVALDRFMNVYVADAGNHVIRKITGATVNSSLKNSPTKSKFELLPNPATSNVTIKISCTGALQILNTLGQVVFAQPASETNEINITNLAKGIYTVRFNGVSQKLMVR